MNTPRLFLRAFNEHDGYALFQYLSKPEVVLFEPYDVYTLEQAILEAKERANDPAFYAVCLKSNHQVIGHLYFSPEGPSHLKTYSLGYVFHPDFQHQGYATEACQALIHDAFTTMKLHRIVAFCNQKNEKSWRLLERLHFRREGDFKRNIFFKVDQEGRPLWVDSFQYGLLNTEYKGE